MRGRFVDRAMKAANEAAIADAIPVVTPIEPELAAAPAQDEARDAGGGTDFTKPQEESQVAIGALGAFPRNS
ncbi:MAG: hypothetical protein IPF94_10780 [Betaproteobacteria bacterium]|nr:hypothetical protein [Betaproteobacteria bacterium]